MIINGASRSNGAFFARHLMRADHNERVHVVEMRGLAYADNVPEAFREMKELASGTRCKNYFYHANLNTRADEVLTPEQWAQAVDALERGLRLDGQPRFIVEHEKEGRVHRHVVWSRIDADTLTTIHDGHNYRIHEQVATELEEAFGHEATARALTRDKETTPRPEPGMKGWEDFRAQDSKIDPKAMRAELTELWQQADSGQAFAAALAERGYILTRGDRRDFCVVDAAGDEHSLGRRISGVKAAEIRARMADIDRDALPSVEEGREQARQRQEQPTVGDATAEPPNTFDAILAETVQEAAPPSPAMPAMQVQATHVAAVGTVPEAKPSAFDAVMAEAVKEAEADSARAAEEEAQPGGRFARFTAWWSSVREYVAEQREQLYQHWNAYFGHDEKDEPQQTPTAGLEPER